MVFQIEYVRDGEVLATVPFKGSWEAAVKAASAGIARHRAKAARVLDITLKGDLVALVEQKRNPRAGGNRSDSPSRKRRAADGSLGSQ